MTRDEKRENMIKNAINLQASGKPGWFSEIYDQMLADMQKNDKELVMARWLTSCDKIYSNLVKEKILEHHGYEYSRNNEEAICLQRAPGTDAGSSDQGPTDVGDADILREGDRHHGGGDRSSTADHGGVQGEEDPNHLD